MKRKIVILIATLMYCILLVGCGKNTAENHSEQIWVYSFSGSNEQFEISNGVIVLTDEDDVFYGGDFKDLQDNFSGITSFSMTFYIMQGNEKRIVLSNSVEDMTGETVNITGSTGKVSDDGIIPKTEDDELQDLKNSLYFELITTDLLGNENTYQLQLPMTEVVGREDK